MPLTRPSLLVLASLALAALCATEASAAPAAVRVVNGSGNPGASITLSVRFTVGDDPISALQFDITGAAGLSFPASNPLARGADLASAKQLASNALSGGSALRVLIYGGTEVLTSGEIARVTLQISSSAQAGDLAVTLVGLDASTPGGTAAATSTTAAKVTITVSGPTCGNGTVDNGEVCGEPTLPACPSNCNDNDACTTDTLSGAAAQCTARCSHTRITSCTSGDGCCPAGCRAAVDNDCPVVADMGTPDLTGRDAGTPTPDSGQRDSAAPRPDSGQRDSASPRPDRPRRDAPAPGGDRGQQDAAQGDTAPGRDATTSDASSSPDRGSADSGQRRDAGPIGGPDAASSPTRTLTGSCAISAEADGSWFLLALLIGLIARFSRPRRLIPAALVSGLVAGLLAGCADPVPSPKEAIGSHSQAAMVGDLDNTRKVDVIDLQLLVNVLLGSETRPTVVARADYDESGRVNTQDLQLLVNLLLTSSPGDPAVRCTIKPAPAFSDQSARVATAARSTTDVQVADLDNDGDLDIIWVGQFDAGSGFLGGIDISINNGNAQFSHKVVGDQNSIGSWFFVVPVDVNGDGYPDLVASRASTNSTQFLLLINDRSGGFAPAPTPLPEVTGTNEGYSFGRVAVGDIDNDGDMDLMLPIFSDTTFATGKANVLLINNGSGTFSRANPGQLPPIAPADDSTNCVAMGDADGDGKVDIFYGSSNTRQRLLINAGAGIFTDQTTDDGKGSARLPDLLMRNYDCRFVDLDEDGDLDLLIANDTEVDANLQPTRSFPNYVYVNDGAGHFTAMALPSPSGGTAIDTRGMAVGDVNGDGFPDIIFSNSDNPVPHGGQTFEVLLQQCDGTFVQSANTPSFPISVYGVAVADFNGDGRVDLVGGATLPDGATTLLNKLLLTR